MHLVCFSKTRCDIQSAIPTSLPSVATLASTAMAVRAPSRCRGCREATWGGAASATAWGQGDVPGGMGQAASAATWGQGGVRPSSPWGPWSIGWRPVALGPPRWPASGPTVARSPMGQPGHRAGPTLPKGHRAGSGLVLRPDGPTRPDTEKASGHISPGQIVLGPGGPSGHLYLWA
jgi:hypothetical protein